jgi:hypothetical protein
MPCVLSAKGLVARHLENSFRSFEKDTSTIRKQYVNNLPAWYFWILIGTFDKNTREQIKAKEGFDTFIVPPKVFLPPEPKESFLEKYYIGLENSTRRDQCKLAAKEWLEAWKKPDNRQQQYDNAPGGVDVHEDNIPF